MTNNVDAGVCNELLRVTRRVYMYSSHECAAPPVKRLLSYCADVGADVSAWNSLFHGNASICDLNAGFIDEADDSIELLCVQYDYLDLGLFSEPWALWIQPNIAKQNPAKKRKILCN
jgi:hypothetical protein